MELEARRTIFTHLPEEALEKYAFGRLAVAELASFEMHLLHCEHCQESLDAEDNFVQAMRVLQQMNQAQTNEAQTNDWMSARLTLSHVVVEAQNSANPKAVATSPARSALWTRLLPSITPIAGFSPAWGAVLLAVLAVGMCVWRIPFGRGFRDDATAPAQAVTLATLRGGGPDGMAEAQAGRPLDLSINIAAMGSSLSEAGLYRLEAVDASGDPRWTTTVSPSAEGQISVHVNQRLGAGTYWVRLYAPSGKLLREFGLHLN